MYFFSIKSCRIVAVCGALVASTILLSAHAAVATTETGAAELGDDLGGAALTPRAEALKLALAAPEAAHQDARTHYQSSAYAGLWFGAEGDARNAEDLLAALAGAEAHGLAPLAYDAPRLRQAVKAAESGAPGDVAAAELLLTRAFLRYAGDLSTGMLEPRAVDREIHVYPEGPAEHALLREAAAAASMAAFLEGLAPRDEVYGRLKAELVALRALPADAWGPTAPEGRSIRLGDRSDAVAAMRARLIAMGDHIAQERAATETDDAAPDPRVYDVALEESVRAFQRRHGLNDDGVAGRRTMRAMNASVADRIGQVIVAMERLRWMKKDLGARHVFVNQADFTVQLVENGETVFSERVVVGKARKHRTPEFSDEMTHMVFNPIWHVPYSIASEEILPKLQEDPDYLTKKNMRLITTTGEAAPDPTLTDWSLYSANDFPFRVKQRSGGGNALGRVKFMFPNQFSIYLHDTPSKRLFKKDARAFSHGCVRVQDPMAFARALLAPQVDDAAAFVDRMLSRSGERRVNLEQTVPVHLTYRTAWVDENGVRQFRDDVYGRDGRILAALLAAGVVLGGADGA